MTQREKDIARFMAELALRENNGTPTYTTAQIKERFGIKQTY